MGKSKVQKPQIRLFLSKKAKDSECAICAVNSKKNDELVEVEWPWFSQSIGEMHYCRRCVRRMAKVLRLIDAA